MDGYFSGANFPSDPDVIKDETTYDPNNPASSMNARKIRWDELLNGNKGKIDTQMAEVFLADHYDTFTKKEGANRRTLCGHGDMEPDDAARVGFAALFAQRGRPGESDR